MSVCVCVCGDSRSSLLGSHSHLHLPPVKTTYILIDLFAYLSIIAGAFMLLSYNYALREADAVSTLIDAHTLYITDTSA